MQSIDSPNYKNVARSLSLVEQALFNLLEHMNLVGFMLLNLELSGYYFFFWTTVCKLDVTLPKSVDHENEVKFRLDQPGLYMYLP
jgi:hypothetical protein